VANIAQRIYEQILVTRCRAGDDGAFTELVGLYQARMAYFVRQLLMDAALADDVLQEVWLAVFRGLPRLRSPASFQAWLYRIARSKACHELRRRHKWIELEEEPAAAAPDSEQEFSPQQAEAIHRSLKLLSPQHREVLILRFLEGMTYEQISEVVGCHVGTVRSRLHHAKSALRRQMEDCHDTQR
jgi:RNA polymerase sigma-70 factor (ECF subfamily)